MTTIPDNLPLLNEAHAAFIQRHTSMTVAASSPQNRPVLARAYGCRVSDDRHLVTVYLCPAHALRLLECLKIGDSLAMAVNRPTSNETLQLKGRITEIAPLSAAGYADMLAYQQSFIEEIEPLGYAPELLRAVVPGGENCMAVSFEPEELFNQTPGPKAGERLGAQT